MFELVGEAAQVVAVEVLRGLELRLGPCGLHRVKQGGDRLPSGVASQASRRARIASAVEVAVPGVSRTPKGRSPKGPSTRSMRMRSSIAWPTWGR